jgi:serine protease Do
MLVGGVLACALLGGGILIGRATTSAGTGTGGMMGNGGINADSGNAITQAVQQIGPAVMNVDTTFGTPTTADYLPRPGENGPRQGAGTGFIIDSKRGLMLTNAHVVAEAKRIQVTTRDGKKYTGRVLGFDRESDIAVVVVDNKTLPAAQLAGFTDAKKLAIGQWTIAIGNPYQNANTVTVGVLSAVGRKLPVPPSERGKAFELTDMMQTDTAINPGNSGGPLCNIKGEVIGINTAIIPYGQGLGFTIPIYKAKAVADQIIKKGKVEHPSMGIEFVAITDALKQELGLTDKKGALITGLTPNSPAAKAGIQQGDVIRKVAGKSVNSEADVAKILTGKKVGDSVQVEVLRNNSLKKTVSLKLQDRPQ